MKASTKHLIATFVWAVLAVPTVLYWHDSILWVGLISVYANVVGHWGAWEAARAAEEAKEAKRATEERKE